MKNPKEQLQEEKRGFFSNLHVCIGLRTLSNYPADSITILVTKCFYILTREAENTSLECRRKFNTFEAVTRWSSFYFSAFRWPGVARTAHTESSSLRVSALSNKHARCVASPSEFILMFSFHCFKFASNFARIAVLSVLVHYRKLMKFSFTISLSN